MIRRRARASTPTPRPLDLTIRLVPRQRPAATATGTGTCVPSVTGIEWRLYADALNPLVSDGGSPATYTMTRTTEDPTPSSETIAIVVSGGYVPSDQDGTYLFTVIGDTCGQPVEWQWQFVDADPPVWSNHVQPEESGDALKIPVYGSADYAKGTGQVTATVGGQTYGPILFVISSAY